ncbi:MAG TPA: GAF domain-containing protein [Longimicrobium sp.]|uniref:GAF domain-containing protein n=1 Tax=Longimicrobium sp. TaxID=2029185 RepID=UPI002ED8E0B4
MNSVSETDWDAARARSLIEQFPGAAAVYQGPEHVIVAASEAYRRMVGRRDLIGLRFRDALPELHGQGFTDLLDGAFRTGVPATGSGVRADWDDDGDGVIERHDVEFTYQPLRDGGGRVWGIVVHVSDITRQTAAQAALRESEARFRAVFEHAATGIALTGMDGVPVAINPGLERMLRYSLAELRVTGLHGVTAPEDREVDGKDARRLRAGELDSYRVEKRLHRKGGSEVWVDMTVSLVRDAEGSPALTLAMITDITERKRMEALAQEQALELEHQIEQAQSLNVELEAATEELLEASRTAEAARERVEFLAHASEVLASSLDFDETLRRVADLAVERLADWCVVELNHPDGRRRTRVVAHRDPERLQWAEELDRRYPADLQAERGAPAVFRTGAPELYPAITDDMLVAAARDEEHLAALRQVGFTAAITVPLSARGSTLGTLSLVSSESGRRYTQDDLAAAEDLGRRAGSAIDNAELLRRTEAAASRSRRIQSFAAALNQAADVAAVAQVCVEHGVGALGADAGSLALMGEDGKSFRIVHAAGFPAGVADRWAFFPLTPGRPLSDAVLEGVPRILGTREAMERYPGTHPHMVDANTAALMVIPLIAGGRTLGALSFSFAVEQEAEDAVRTLLLTLGEQAAQALERARLLEAEQQLRARAELLADAGEVLSASLALDDTFGALARLVVPAIADWCFVELARPDGGSDAVAVHHSDPAKVAWVREVMARYPVDPSAPYGTAQVIRSGQPELAPEIPVEMYPAVAQDEEHLRALEATGFRSYLSLPLLTRDGVIGVLTLVQAESDRRFSEADIPFGEDLARRAAVAIDNARLYEAERRARAAAEQANQAKSDFLSAMSHELRTPLNAIGGYTELLEMEIRGPVTVAQRQDLERIRRAQQHLLGLISDLLNFAQIEAGRIEYRIGPVPVQPLLTELEPLIQPQMEAKGLAYLRPEGEEATVARGDAERIRQILVNLLANAVKFTDAGSVTLSTRADADRVYIVVADTGRGIAADKLPTVFDPFVQVDRKLTSVSQQGVGLGLSISRELALAMDGTLTAESTPGQGSAFTLTLPRDPGEPED